MSENYPFWAIKSHHSQNGWEPLTNTCSVSATWRLLRHTSPFMLDLVFWGGRPLAESDMHCPAVIMCANSDQLLSLPFVVFPTLPWVVAPAFCALQIYVTPKPAYTHGFPPVLSAPRFPRI